MVIYPVCSSSKGNCIYIKSKETAILVDVGISFKALINSLSLAGLSEKNIKAIFITHEHSDHVSGLYSATKFLGVPVYSSKETLKALIIKDLIFKGTKLYEIDKKIANIFNLSVGAFRVFHDSADGVRFKIFDGEKKFSVCTDVGMPTVQLIETLKDSDFVLLESNYDVEMLKKGRYPFMLKKRIASSFGHLSNYDAAKVINALIEKGVKKFLLGHLSQNNNLPQIALKTVVSYLLEKGKKFNEDYFLYVAPVRSIGKIFEI